MTAQPAVVASDAPLTDANSDADEHAMRVVEWLVAGVALVASLLLALPR
jgi:hypothetical protein